MIYKHVASKLFVFVLKFCYSTLIRHFFQCPQASIAIVAVVDELESVAEVVFHVRHVVCHLPSSYVLDVVVGKVLCVVMVEEGGGSSPAGATHPASAGGAVSVAGSAYWREIEGTAEVVFVFEVDVLVDSEEVEVVQSTDVNAVEVSVTKATAGDGASSSALMTLYDGGEVGDGVFVMSSSILTVFAGSDSLTTIVDTTVSVEAGRVLVGAVTVSVCSDVCVIVLTAGALAGGGVAAEPPSTATTE